jgi:8-oxo-dGTP diphosphatase
MKHIEVVAAVVVHENKILCVQRNHNKYDYISFKYEFPGGKVELNETQENAIIREIFEELNLKISIQKHLITVNHSYPDFKITMNTFLCNCSTKDIVLNEHIDAKWLDIKELSILDWAAADLPIVTFLMEN